MAYNPTNRGTYMDIDKIDLLDEGGRAKAIAAILVMCDEVMGVRPSVATVKVMVDNAKDNLIATATEETCKEFLYFFKDANGGVDTAKMVRALRVRGIKVICSGE